MTNTTSTGLASLLAISLLPATAEAQREVWARGWDGNKHTTVFEDAQKGTHAGDGCAWAAAADTFPNPLISSLGPGISRGVIPGYLGTDINGWEIGIACAFGQLIAAAVAGDNVTFLHAVGSHAHESDEWVMLYRVDTSACESTIAGELKPKFKIHADVENDASLHTEEVVISGRSIMTISALELIADLQGEITQTDSGGSGSGSFKGWGFTLPLIIPSTGGAESTVSFIGPVQSGSASATTATMMLQTSASVSVSADGWTQFPFQDDSKVDGFLYDSMAGGRMVGTCSEPNDPNPLDCTGTRTVTCSWY